MTLAPDYTVSRWTLFSLYAIGARRMMKDAGLVLSPRAWLAFVAGAWSVFWAGPVRISVKVGR